MSSITKNTAFISKTEQLTLSCLMLYYRYTVRPKTFSGPQSDYNLASGALFAYVTLHVPVLEYFTLATSFPGLSEKDIAPASLDTAW